MIQETDLIAHARQHALGDIPRRTAQRFPNKTAIIDGDSRLTFSEFDDVVEFAEGESAVPVDDGRLVGE
ncbi:MAG TPA: hypothetical protein VFC57_02365, partial [Aeromicrobium sp.]|nr:hypothetical protein [Aeromicrobium sp.]